MTKIYNVIHVFIHSFLVLLKNHTRISEYKKWLKKWFKRSYILQHLILYYWKLSFWIWNKMLILLFRRHIGCPIQNNKSGSFFFFKLWEQIGRNKCQYPQAAYCACIKSKDSTENLKNLIIKLLMILGTSKFSSVQSLSHVRLSATQDH